MYINTNIVLFLNDEYMQTWHKQSDGTLTFISVALKVITIHWSGHMIQRFHFGYSPEECVNPVQKDTWTLC